MLRLTLTLSAALAVTAPSLRAQAAPAPPPPDEQTAVAQIRAVEQQWGRAFVERDSTLLAPLLHRGFIGVYPTRWFDREDFMRDAVHVPAAGERRLLQSHPDPDMVIRVFGGTAIVHGTAIQEVETGRPDRRARGIVRTPYTETFIWEDGRWQAIAGHYAPAYTPLVIPAGPPSR